MQLPLFSFLKERCRGLIQRGRHGGTNWSPCLFISLVVASGVTSAQPADVLRFTQNTMHCAFLQGGASYVGDTAAAEFAADLEHALQSLERQGAKTHDAVQRIKTLCMQHTTVAARGDPGRSRPGELGR